MSELAKLDGVARLKHAAPAAKLVVKFQLFKTPFGDLGDKAREWPWLASLVELQARTIRNPVSRLRFLRTATGSLHRERTWWDVLRPFAASSIALAILWVLPGSGSGRSDRVTPPSRPAPASRAASPATTEPRPPEVWMVDRQLDHEIYSNGLRIETALAGHTQPRSWIRLNLKTSRIERGDGPPVGIVYHSTESHIAPFSSKENQLLRRVGEDVLAFVRRNHSYHYLIDRFGRVHRAVAEEDAANHAGVSIWGDAQSVYLNLNSSFIGVSLEAVTANENGDRNPITPAQMHALKTLTAMLRSRYDIPAARCVVHAQVSVNPSNFQMGHHTDWASGFPFADLGLPDNYALPLSSMTVFGFGYGPEFLATGAAAWTGLAISERQVRQQSAASAVNVPLYRSQLQERYRSVMGRMLPSVPDKEDLP